MSDLVAGITAWLAAGRKHSAKVERVFQRREAETNSALRRLRKAAAKARTAKRCPHGFVVRRVKCAECA
jgi:hypothetical protein